ncbi:MAG: DUF427 domain-containing protein [Planctomycetota bacterium]
MAKAVFHGQVVAESDDIVEVESNAYFPIDALDKNFFKENTDVKTHCPWKGDASYFDVVVGDQTADYAAWYYPEPKEAAAELKNRVAFWRGVKVEK